MTTYDNLNIATVSLTFQGEADPSISTRTFNLSTIDFLPNVPLIDQIEVERIFDTGFETKFGGNIFTIADRRQMFILPKAWYSINEQTKILTVVDLSTIPTWTQQNNLYYPNSRTFILETLDEYNAIQTIDIPNFLFNNVAINTPYIRQPDIVIIRRKTLSIDSIVTFAPGTRLTTTQLNLQFNQLKYIVQELISKLRNESILKYDENAIDGPFLGGSDLRMSNNYIKDMNSVPIHKTYASYSSAQDGNVNYTGSTFAANVGVVHDALTQGTICRTTMQDAYSGEFTATPSGGSPLRITGMADGQTNSDAATLGQVRNATNITTGTLTNNVLSNIPLSKLSAIAGQTFTLLPEYLANSGATAESYGVSTAGNTNNMVYMTVDAKGRITAIASRNMTVDDLPISGVGASTYGNGATPLVELVVDSKGRITGATERAITAADISSVNASAVTGTLTATNLPSGVVTAGVTNIPNSISVDTYGRVTAISGGSIPAANVSGFDTQVRTNRLDQMTAPTASVSFNSQKITNLATPTLSTDAASKGYVDGYAAPLSTFNTAVTNLIQSNSVYWDSGNDRYTAQRSAVDKKITGVANPSNNNDAVNLNYFNTNALVVSGGVISAASTPITNMTMRAAGSVTANDAVNYGFIENLVLTPGTTLIGSTTPQIYRDAWSSLTKTSSHLTGFDRYQRTFTDLGAVASTMVLLEADSVTKTFVPYSVAATSGTVHDGYFWLDTSGGANKVLNVWLTTGTTPSGNLVTRNFGLSRLVSGALATTSSTGLVSILAGNDGGINVSAGELSLKTATASQIGGIKLGAGLVDIGASVIKVDLSDSTSLNNSNKAASSKAVKDTYDYAVGVNSTVSSLSSTVTSVSGTATTAQTTANAALARTGGTMTGKLTTVTPASGTASIVLPSGSAPTTPVSGDVWNNAGTLQFYNGSATKNIAFTDSNITGNAATATQWATGRTIQLTGAVTGISDSFNGTGNLSFATSLSSTAAVTSLQGTANQVLVNTGSGTATTGAITLTLPQSIHTAATPTFGSVTAKNLTLGSSNNTIISTDTNGNINLDPNGTGIVNIQSPLDVDGTLNVDGATTLVGAVTISSPSTLTLLNSEGKISLGAASSTTSINRQVSTSAPATSGDLVLRVPTNGKAWLVANDSINTAPIATDEVITKLALDTALGSYATTASLSSYMAQNGSLASGNNNNQTLGTPASSSGSFVVKTNNTDRLTINSTGTATFAGAVTADSLSLTNKATSAATISNDGDTTLTTKGYVDARCPAKGALPAFYCRCFGSISLAGANETSAPTLLTSGNVASVQKVDFVNNGATGNGYAGRYRITFTTAMPDANYTVVLGAGRLPTGYTGNQRDDERTAYVYAKTTGYFDIIGKNGADTYYDSMINWAVFA